MPALGDGKLGFSPWWSYGDVAIRFGGHPHIFYGHFPDAGWGAAPDREHHATLFLAREAIIGDQGVDPGYMEDCLQSKITRRTRDPTP